MEDSLDGTQVDFTQQANPPVASVTGSGTDAQTDASSEFAIPSWLADKYSTTVKVAAPVLEPPSDPSTGPTSSRPSRITASAFKPTRRKPTAQPMTNPMSPGSSAAALGQTPVSDQPNLEADRGPDEALVMADDIMAEQPLSTASGGADSALDAALKADADMTDEAVDEAAAGLSPGVTAAMDTMLSSEADPSSQSNPGADSYSAPQSVATGFTPAAENTLEAGDLSPGEVDQDPRLTSEADAIIDAGVAAVTSDDAGLPQEMGTVFHDADDGQIQPTDTDTIIQNFIGAGEGSVSICVSASLSLKHHTYKA